MKEELQGKLVEILTSIQAAAAKASDFAMEQLPDIAQSYVVYGRVASLVWTLAGLALLAFSIVVYRAARRVKNRDNAGFFVFMGADYGVAGVSFVLGWLCFAHHVNTALLVWFAPKVWLLKELASLIK